MTGVLKSRTCLSRKTYFVCLSFFWRSCTCRHHRSFVGSAQYWKRNMSQFNVSLMDTAESDFPWASAHPKCEAVHKYLYIFWSRGFFPSVFHKKNKNRKYLSTRSVFESFSPIHTKRYKDGNMIRKYDSIPYRACVMLVVSVDGTLVVDFERSIPRRRPDT